MSEETTVEKKHGIKETKELVKFGISVGESIDLSLADGKIGLDDAMNFYNAVLSAGDAFKDISKVPAELGDLDQEERDELLAFVEAEFDIANDKLEAVIEEALKTALQVYKLVETVRGMRA
jgi:hypothetical protein